MPTTVTWNDGVAPPTTITISDDVMASLVRQSQTYVTYVNGQPTPLYPGTGTQPVQAWLVALFSQQIVTPALLNFPPAAVQTALAALATAQAGVTQAKTAVAEAQASTITGFVPAAT